jgi:hypothetical protein
MLLNPNHLESALKKVPATVLITGAIASWTSSG